jgi:Ser/Thr protein kinase RdoA (MazF antagonist)
MGAALARAHASLAGEIDCLDGRLVWPWVWAEECLVEIPMPAGVRDAARRVLDEARRVTLQAGMPVQVVHGDPAREAFVLDRTRPERDGLIDWSATMGAPALYDLGCLTVTTGDRPDAVRHCVRGYVDVAPGSADFLPHRARDRARRLGSGEQPGPGPGSCRDDHRHDRMTTALGTAWPPPPGRSGTTRHAG